MNGLMKILIVFLCITGASTLMMDTLNIPFGDDNYWDTRGVFFLFFVTLFPRLTLLFSSVAFGGILWWLAWFFSPRFLVAYLATVTYWNSNPILVVISWLIAIGGETSEKSVVINRGKPFGFKRTIIINGKKQSPFGDSFEGSYQNQQENFEEQPRARYNVSEGDTFEAEFEVKKD